MRCLSDDVSLVGFDEAGLPVVSADARQLKLADAAIDALGLASRRGNAVPGAAGKSYVSPPSHSSGAALPLGAVYLLGSRSEDGTAIARLDTATALHALRRSAHRPGLVRRTGQSAHFFTATAKILAHARVFRIERRRDLADLTATTVVLDSHWREIGLGRGASDEARTGGDGRNADFSGRVNGSAR